MKFTVTFKKGPEVVAFVEGFKDVDEDCLSMKEATEVFEMESLLEKITGYRVHINESA